MNEENIMLIGLIGGTTVIGEAAEVANAIQLTKPVQIVQMADQKNDRMVPAMVSYAIFADKSEILVSATAIEYIAVPKATLIEEYKKMISPIITPQKSIITPA